MENGEIVAVLFDFLPVEFFLSESFHGVVEFVSGQPNKSRDEKRRFSGKSFEYIEDEWNSEAVADINRFEGNEFFVVVEGFEPVFQSLSFGSRKLRDNHMMTLLFKFRFKPRKPVFLRSTSDAVDDEDICHDLDLFYNSPPGGIPTCKL